jgi:hypothetical protein
MTARTIALLLASLSAAACGHQHAATKPAAAAPAVAARSQTQSSPLMAKIEGWTMSDGPTTYTPETLFEYIDGGADAFLQLDFDELVAGEYKNARAAAITVDVYRHRDSFCAFGMYALERPAGTTPIAVGIEGHAGADYLQFVVGSYYVKLAQAGRPDPSALRAFAEKLAAGLAGTREPPAILKCFPSRGRLPRAEKLAAHNFLGHAFLHDAAAAAYDVDGARLRVFAVRGKDDGDVRDMVRRYLAVGGSPNIEAKPEGAASVKDPLNGEVTLKWKGHWLWGAVDQSVPARTMLVDELGRCLARAAD